MVGYQMGIIGYGDMGKWHAQNIASRLPQLKVKGVYDIKPERNAEATQAGLISYQSVTDLLSDQSISLVLIATPNNFHADYSIMSMNAGKHVVCEKPACLNAKQLQQVLAVSVNQKKLFTVHQNRRWDIDFAVVQQSLQSGVIGNPYYIDSRLYGSKGLPGDWRSAPEAGGGMLYDWASHLIDQMLCLVNSKPTHIYCELLSVKFPSVDDCNRINIKFENGVRGSIVVDSWCYIAEPRWHISADDGTLIVNDWFGTSGKIVKANIKKIDWEKGVIFTSSGRTRTMAPRPKEHLTELPLVVPSEPRWEEFYENVMDVMGGKAPPLVTHEQQLTLMRVLDACRISGETNQVVKL